MAEGYTVKETLKRLEKQMEKRFDEVTDLQKETNGRVRLLEAKWAYLTGAVAFALALGLPNLGNLISLL